jgi:hypothetical protein
LGSAGNSPGAEVAAPPRPALRTPANRVASSHPEHYLEDVIGRVDTTPVSQIAKLTPWAWADERAKAAAD